jgi:hypothetical protein
VADVEGHGTGWQFGNAASDVHTHTHTCMHTHTNVYECVCVCVCVCVYSIFHPGIYVALPLPLPPSPAPPLSPSPLSHPPLTGCGGSEIRAVERTKDLQTLQRKLEENYEA